MKPQKTFLLFPLLVISLLSPQYSHAVTVNKAARGTMTKEVTEAAPIQSPVCNLEAAILTAEKNPDNPDYYEIQVDIKMINISVASEATACNADYGEQIRKSGLTMKTSDYLKQALQKGNIIRAKVRFESDGTMTGYFPSGIEITGQADDNAQTANAAKNDSTTRIIGAISVLTILVLAGMIYSSRKRTMDS